MLRETTCKSTVMELSKQTRAKGMAQGGSHFHTRRGGTHRTGLGDPPLGVRREGEYGERSAFWIMFYMFLLVMSSSQYIYFFCDLFFI